ncbi:MULTISPECIES: helix-turn-helix domain-containing protein [unclassified Methylobacterium]|uniref:helix-turn-helix domain-containing protein n=1 Tax=unclassified Methylobacterium TaxID=2615210 RepID=UPI0009E82401|nr:MULTISPECIES: helix-turn-helix transcriptional regulator [unclassified Methylobacterium]TXN33014.1 helix-turn-helix transcriptional regulator [Methylobacterium sp. WL19]
MSDDNKDRSPGAIGVRIKSLRRSAGLSQASLGNALGVTFQQVQKYESGQSKIAADKLQRIAQTLGVDISYFYDMQSESGSTAVVQKINDVTVPLEDFYFKDAFDKIKDPRARYLLAELARVFCEIESKK